MGLRRFSWMLKISWWCVKTEEQFIILLEGLVVKRYGENRKQTYQQDSCIDNTGVLHRTYGYISCRNVQPIVKFIRLLPITTKVIRTPTETCTTSSVPNKIIFSSWEQRTCRGLELKKKNPQISENLLSRSPSLTNFLLRILGCDNRLIANPVQICRMLCIMSVVLHGFTSQQMYNRRTIFWKQKFSPPLNGITKNAESTNEGK